MGRLLEDSSGVIVGRIPSKGATKVEKVGDWMDAPKHRFGKDTGATERILTGYLLIKRKHLRFTVL